MNGSAVDPNVPASVDSAWVMAVVRLGARVSVRRRYVPPGELPYVRKRVMTPAPGAVTSGSNHRHFAPEHAAPPPDAARGNIGVPIVTAPHGVAWSNASAGHGSWVSSP
jgi:hypothetical protein